MLHRWGNLMCRILLSYPNGSSCPHKITVSSLFSNELLLTQNHWKTPKQACHFEHDFGIKLVPSAYVRRPVQSGWEKFSFRPAKRIFFFVWPVMAIIFCSWQRVYLQKRRKTQRKELTIFHSSDRNCQTSFSQSLMCHRCYCHRVSGEFFETCQLHDWLSGPYLLRVSLPWSVFVHHVISC